MGSAVLDALVAAGHQVTAVVRSQASSLAVSDRGGIGIIGDLFDAPWLSSAARPRCCDPCRCRQRRARSRANDAVATAVIDAFGGTDKPFIHTGGIWTYGNNSQIVETNEPAPPTLTAWRPAGEQRLLEADIRATVIQPAVVYGRGAGIPAMLTHAAAEDGTLALIGSGEQHWATVHVDDLADLYVLALQAPGKRAYVGASGENPTVRELGEALTSAVTPESDEATVARLGLFGEALLLDQQASGQRAKTELEWRPSRPTLVELPWRRATPTPSDRAS
ncbi:NAD-dependent epimerase/dehydratase family protein [Aeromicrobium sp. UC242_57]|uniref:NAD-dependent epimerase/dehydratase family protein n=1 Tax=Aeromicrobium sp. UC242_57 TaxID=3374624 RepID=UPI00379519DC